MLPMYSGFALGGLARSGKNAIGERLGQFIHLAEGWPTLLSFATPLREMVAQENGHARKHGGGREAMIRIGDREREKDPDVFVNTMADQLDLCVVAGCVPIITDVRRLNEFRLCNRRGLFTVYVAAPLEDRVARMRARGEDARFATSTHATETEALGFDWDLVVDNVHSVYPENMITQIATEIIMAADRQ